MLRGPGAGPRPQGRHSAMAPSAPVNPAGRLLALVILVAAARVAIAAAPSPSVPVGRAATLPRVLAPDGTPVAGATVSFIEYDRNARVVIRTATTTAPDGTFRLLPPGEPAADAEEG